MGASFGWVRREVGRDGRQGHFTTLHLARLSFIGNLRNFHDQRRVLEGALHAHTPTCFGHGLLRASNKNAGECAFCWSGAALPEGNGWATRSALWA